MVPTELPTLGTSSRANRTDADGLYEDIFGNSHDRKFLKAPRK